MQTILQSTSFNRHKEHNMWTSLHTPSLHTLITLEAYMQTYNIRSLHAKRFGNRYWTSTEGTYPKQCHLTHLVVWSGKHSPPRASCSPFGVLCNPLLAHHLGNLHQTEEVPHHHP
jgi:hypothetical protein